MSHAIPYCLPLAILPVQGHALSLKSRTSGPRRTAQVQEERQGRPACTVPGPFSIKGQFPSLPSKGTKECVCCVDSKDRMKGVVVGTGEETDGEGPG